MKAVGFPLHPALNFGLVGVSRLHVLLPFSAALIFFLNASVQKENGGNARERERASLRLLTQV
ncbi:hypothetical protein SAMN02745702_02332 [Desulfobaculum bizertense DSM 18034]|uniref:Uncharacterized protein n=1 Tax=Desulfobaculum bizertense DSM 18034 TaxID=1121442 RepID=A0A1T4WKA0_9BACT|nr:hypothetical protein SAMN02745702_02332 [Desulfobaculum bizertense DSM 18034]